MKIPRNSISIAGEFAVLSQLALRGIDANLTLGHTKSVDILASNPQTGSMFKLEVKTSYDQKPATSRVWGRTLIWVMGAKHETITDPNLFYCFVNIQKEASTFQFFLVPSHVVATYNRASHQFWLVHNIERKSKHVDSAIRNFRLGMGTADYPVVTPLAEDYENKWDF
jgi:hypothetical protein